MASATPFCVGKVPPSILDVSVVPEYRCGGFRFDIHVKGKVGVTGPNQWAVHVPLGKLKTERLVPVDPFVKFVQRLRFFRSLERLPEDGFLLPLPRSKEALIRQLRDYLHQVCHEIGLSTPSPRTNSGTRTPPKSSGRRCLPALMNLLRHVDPDMTMRYLDLTLTDLKREFELARSKPRDLTPSPTLQSPRFELGLPAS